MEVVHIKGNLQLVAKFSLGAGVDPGGETMGSIDQVEEDFVTHQLGHIHGHINQLGDDTWGSEFGLVNVFRANTKNDIFPDHGFVASNIVLRDLHTEGIHVNKHLTFFHNNLTIEEVHGRGANEACHKEIGRMIIEHLRGVQLLQLTLIHNGNTGRHSHGFSLVVGDIDEGCFKAFVQFGELSTGLNA